MMAPGHYTAGDVNGDGYSDAIVGAHSYDNDQINEGGSRSTTARRLCEYGSQNRCSCRLGIDLGCNVWYYGSVAA